MNDHLAAVVTAIDEMDLDGIEERVQTCLDNGIGPEEVIEKGISRGLDLVGQKFEEGEYFLGELVMAGEVVKMGMTRVAAVMDPAKALQKGKVVIATVEGDIHEIGKNILGMILSTGGWEVIDLGVDVPAAKIIKTIKESGARLIGLSILLTTTIGTIKEVNDGLREAGLRDQVRIAIGGACCSQKLADDMGADAYGETAVEGGRIFDTLAESLS